MYVAHVALYTLYSIPILQGQTVKHNDIVNVYFLIAFLIFEVSSFDFFPVVVFNLQLTRWKIFKHVKMSMST